MSARAVSPQSQSGSKALPPLQNTDKYAMIVTRFAPNPDFVLHLGSIRAIILSHDYARMYKGRFLLRFDDTDPRLKKSALEYYDLIREDVRWLECQWDAEYIASDRIPVYYEHAEKVLKSGDAYICTCTPDNFRLNVNAGRACPDRSKTPEQNLTDWAKMLNGGFGEGEAVLRIKTDLAHPNPAVRDWPALRRRGYVPSALRRIVYEMGPRPVDATLSWDNVNATNRKEIDKIAHRYSFIANPITITVSGVERTYDARLPLHPERKDLPDRIFKVVPKNGTANLLISSSDIDLLKKSKVVRLMELFNVEIKNVENNSIMAAFHSQDYMKAREVKAHLVNWLPDEINMVGEVVMPDASRTKGPVETNIRQEKVGSIIQMVRFGFGRIDSINEEQVTVYYAHR